MTVNRILIVSIIVINKICSLLSNLKKYIVLRIRLRLKLVSFSDFMIEMFLIEMNFFIEMNFSIKTNCFLIEMNRPCHGFRRHLDE